MPAIRDILRLLRPAQWIKNAVVFAPAFFSLWNAASPGGWTSRLRAAILPSLAVFATFCLVSSAVYVLNDILDAPQDRLHPRKRFRPIASGTVSLNAACIVFVALLCVCTGPIAFIVNPVAVSEVILAYFILQIAYMVLLKHIPLLDVVCIATGFVLRAVAGARATGVVLSPWLLACTFLLALFLALCKRRQEKAELADSATETRPSLARLSLRTLDRAVNVSAGVTILCYAAYTQAPATVANFGSRRLCLTLPFVAVGIARYLFLLRRRDEGDRPERVLLTDIPLLFVILLFGLGVAAVFLLRNF